MSATLSILRADLEFSSQQHLGKNFTVVKDPLTKRYFRFTESQNVILDLLREPRDAEAVAAAASEQLRGNVPVETIESFLQSLEDKLLIDTESVRDKLERYPRQKPGSR